ncbi:MAG TPA: hypothetical protein VIY28_19910 [Pseudonocardiaceae bacterium]
MTAQPSTEREARAAGSLVSMSLDHENVRPPRNSASQGKAAVRGGWSGWTPWSEDEHTKTDIRECTDASCMSVDVNCGFQGLDPGSPLSQAAAVSGDLRAAWKTKLESEGKATSGTKSLRDIVFGPAE